MLSGIVRCVANPGRGIAKVSQRMVNTSTHLPWSPSAPTSIHNQFFLDPPVSKQSGPESVDALINGLFHQSVYHPYVGRTSHGVQSFSCFPTNLDKVQQSIVDPSVFGIVVDEEISLMNRNARRPKRANHGARPCSRSSRRFKKEKIGKRSRG